MSKSKQLKDQGALAYITAMTQKFPDLRGTVRHDLAEFGDVGVLMEVPPALIALYDDVSEESAFQTRRIGRELGIYVLPTWIPPYEKEATTMADELVIAGKTFRSRLFVGTGKYDSPESCIAALDASGAEMVTVAIRRLDLDNPNARTELDYIDWERYFILPNTAGSKTAEEAVFTAKLARELTGSNWVKLEVIPDPRYLLPDPIGTLEAAETLIKDGFIVLPYIHADPVLAKRLEEAGCATVMPLGSPIGSGRGIFTVEEIQIIIENAGVPVVVDAGLGAPSEASLALELGADAVLVNTAIAKAKDPAGMAEGFKLGVEAGRKAYVAGRIEKKAYAAASSPLEGVATAR